MKGFANALDKIVYVLQEMDEGRRRAANRLNGHNHLAMKKSARVITVV